MEYGTCIEVGARVEISPHYDLWMMGARYGAVVAVSPSKPHALVKHDHGMQRWYPIADLIRR